MDKYKFIEIFSGLFLEFVRKTNKLLGRRKCYICKKNFFCYLPVYGDHWYLRQLNEYGPNYNFRDMTYNRKEYRCPYCNSIDRTRFIMMYVHKNFRSKTGMNILYFAPTSSGIYFLKNKMQDFHIDTDDLYDKTTDYHYDIQNMEKVEDSTYDLIICSHVLEHVADDRLALKELYRITKKNGQVLILVPLDLKKVWFDEENGLSEFENWKRFGQTDHVRRYTHDELIKRITEAGFQCRVYTNAEVGKKAVVQNAFNKNIRIYVAEKRV